MKTKVMIGILTIFIISLIFNGILFVANNKNKKEMATLNETIIASQDTLRSWKDKNGKLYSEKEVLVVDYNKIKTANDLLLSTIEKQRKELKVRPKEIQYVNVEVVKTETVVQTVIKDSCYVYTDAWNDFKFCKDILSIKIADTTNTMLYTKKYIQNPSKLFFIRWFQHKDTKYELNITHANPLIKTTDLKTITNLNKK